MGYLRACGSGDSGRLGVFFFGGGEGMRWWIRWLLVETGIRYITRRYFWEGKKGMWKRMLKI